jgi:hypothetical protein
MLRNDFIKLNNPDANGGSEIRLARSLNIGRLDTQPRRYSVLLVVELPYQSVLGQL